MPSANLLVCQRAAQVTGSSPPTLSEATTQNRHNLRQDRADLACRGALQGDFNASRAIGAKLVVPDRIERFFVIWGRG